MSDPTPATNTRRQFLGLAVCVSAGSLFGLALRDAVNSARPRVEPQRIYRKTDSGWERVRMRQLCPGDIVRMPESFEGESTVVIEPAVNADGRWEVTLNLPAGH